ncbi:hypothetical protein Ahy_A10g048088 [Arachis hypogaea]|uniref:Uncharacterized protein n=1 Tax=Arachis hypogaea TaxID=3818 RepID=A0A445B495_ARAHY|nr:hypothetical protein Ahy_A10g048088 [Arachis hypogaea]
MFFYACTVRSELGTEVLEEFLTESKKKKNNEKAAAQGFVIFGCILPILRKKGADLRSTEDHYDSSKMLSLVEELANDPAQQNMMVVRMEIHSQPEALSIVTIQTIPVPAIEPSPVKSPREKISEKIRYMSTRSNPAPEDAAALMMMARTTSYIPKEVKKKHQRKRDRRQKIVTAMCLILNQQNIKRFQEEIYCLLPDIVNMAIGNYPDEKFLRPKTKKPFRVKDYQMFIPFLDLKKLASHQYSIGGYGWLTNM